MDTQDQEIKYGRVHTKSTNIEDFSWVTKEENDPVTTGLIFRTIVERKRRSKENHNKRERDKKRRKISVGKRDQKRRSILCRK